MHVHHLQDEAIQVISGRMGHQTLNGPEQFAGPGELVVWPAGTPHRWWNAGSGELHSTGWCQPPDNVEFYLSSIFASVRENDGRPGLFDAAFLTTRYRTEFELIALPLVVRRIVMPILYGVGKILGKHRSTKTPRLPSRAIGGRPPTLDAGDMSQMLAILLSASLQLSPAVPAVAQVAPTECARFESKGRLGWAHRFKAALLQGLEFRLSKDWMISVGPVGQPDMDYLWVVSPPLRTAPHTIIGPAYGESARSSAKIERPLRFVTTRADHDAAVAAIDLEDAGETLKRLERLGSGHLTLVITDYRIRDVTLADGRQGDAFDWVTFRGEACAPKAVR